MPALRRTVVGVMGSGTTSNEPLASQLGTLIAEEGFDLLAGGGGGCMESVARAFVNTERRRGISIGVLPGIPPGTDWNREVPENVVGEEIVPPPGYPNPHVELVVQTHLPTSGAGGQEMTSRNHINILSSDVIIAMAGGPGTCNECALARRYKKPLLVFFGEGGTIVNLDLREVQVATNIADVAAWLKSVLPSDKPQY